MNTVSIAADTTEFKTQLDKAQTAVNSAEFLPKSVYCEKIETTQVEKDTCVNCKSTNIVKDTCRDCGSTEIYKQGFCYNCYTFHYGPRVEPIKRVFKRVGRNATCPCGSGLKFKNCCKTEINLLKKAEDIAKNA